ncbi:MAG: ATP-binding protein [bacterium]
MIFSKNSQRFKSLMDEGQTYDKKSLLTFAAEPKRWDWQKIAKHCVAFANAGGGILHFGIEDDLSVPPPDQRIAQTLPDRLRKGVSQHCVNVAVTPEIQIANNGGEILELRVLQSRQTIASTTDGRYFIRVADESKPVMPDELPRLLADKDAYVWETQATRRIPVASANPVQLSRFLSDIRASDRVTDFVKEKNDVEILEHFLMARDGVLSNLGILWVGRREDRAVLLFAPAVQFIKYDGSEQKVAKREWSDFDLNPKEMIEAIWKEIPDWREYTEIRDGLFTETVPHYDETVLRELLANALCHRPYTTRGDIFIRLYPDRLEIQNPGLLPLGVTPKNILHTSVQRNRHLAQVFYALHLMEREGSGYDRMYDALLSRGRPVPVLREENDSVTVCVERRIMKPEIVSLLSTASQQFNLRPRERICLGLIAQHGLLKASDFNRILDLSDDTRVRSWLGSLLDKKLLLSRGRTRATEYLVNPEWLRLSQAKGPTTLKKIEPHRLRHLILEDLQTYSPDETSPSSLSDLHRRIGSEIPLRTLRHAIGQLREEAAIQHNGKRGVGSRYFIRHKDGK